MLDGVAKNDRTQHPANLPACVHAGADHADVPPADIETRSPTRSEKKVARGGRDGEQEHGQVTMLMAVAATMQAAAKTKEQKPRCIGRFEDRTCVRVHPWSSRRTG